MSAFALTQSRPVKLLVSVRNATEAQAALAGGAEILDIKEPRHGSLGKADDAAIREIVEAVNKGNANIPLSAALGELLDWANSQAIPQLAAGLNFVKLGLANANKLSDWQFAMRDFQTQCFKKNPHPPAWVAVIYADWQTANAPSPAAIIKAAVDLSCVAVLVDTFHKNGNSLGDVLSPEELQSIADSVHAAGLPLAVAGSFKAEHLESLVRFDPQVVAIRSAACVAGIRNAEICPQAIRQFREELEANFPARC